MDTAKQVKDVEDDRRVSEFSRKVYTAVSEIPVGCVSTYQQVALRIGCRSARAVGQALRVNPYAPRVPCHRVIASDLTPGGFQGCRGGAAVKRKLDRLAKEGVRFSGGRLAEPARVFEFSGRPWPACNAMPARITTRSDAGGRSMAGRGHRK